MKSSIGKLAVGFSLLLSGSFVQAELSSISDEELGEVTGQSGITIDADVQVSVGAIDYVDADGDGSGGATSGTLRLQTVAFDDGSGGAVSLNGITVDVDGSGLKIGLPSITGTLSVGGLYLGNTTTSAGSLSVSNLNLSGTTVSISAH